MLIFSVLQQPNKVYSSGVRRNHKESLLYWYVSFFYIVIIYSNVFFNKCTVLATKRLICSHFLTVHLLQTTNFAVLIKLLAPINQLFSKKERYRADILAIHWHGKKMYFILKLINIKTEGNKREHINFNLEFYNWLQKIC